MTLLSIAVNGYAANVTTNNNEEDITINVTANRTALLDLDTPVAMNVITPEDLKILVLPLLLMRWRPYQG